MTAVYCIRRAGTGQEATKSGVGNKEMRKGRCGEEKELERDDTERRRRERECEGRKYEGGTRVVMWHIAELGPFFSSMAFCPFSSMRGRKGRPSSQCS